MQKEKEKAVLIFIIGCMESIMLNGISILECQNIIFSPFGVNKLRELSCNEKIVSIVEKACELEDVESLIPNKLPSVIDNLKTEAVNCLKEYMESDYDTWHNLVFHEN